MPDPETPNTDYAAAYPGIIFAYDFVKPSYDLAVNRFEAAVNRVQALMTFGVTITLGVPLFDTTTAKTAKFSSRFFIAAMALFVILMIVGLIARVYGRLMLVRPAALYDITHLDEWSFKRHALYYAGENWEHNRKVVEVKSRLSAVVAGLLLEETVSLVLWLVTS